MERRAESRLCLCVRSDRHWPAEGVRAPRILQAQPAPGSSAAARLGRKLSSWAIPSRLTLEGSRVRTYDTGPVRAEA